MNFFQQLFDQIDGVDLAINIKRKNGKLTLSVLPNATTKISPAMITGTPEELDEGFFQAIAEPISISKGLKVDLDQMKASVETAKKETTKATEKNPEGKAEKKDKKVKENKSAPAKAEKKAVEKPKTVEEKKPAVQEQNLFA